MNGKNKIIKDLYEKHKTTFDYIQLIVLVMAAVAVFARYMHWVAMDPILLISLCLLAFLFAFKGIALGANKSIGDLMLYMGLSVFTMGLLYWLKHWQAPMEIIYSGGALAIVGFILKIILPAKTTD
jgi:hypothetical protein